MADIDNDPQHHRVRGRGKKALMEQLSYFHKRERGSHPPGGGQKKFFPRYGKKKFQKSAFLAGIDDVEEEGSPDGENVVDEPDEA